MEGWIKLHRGLMDSEVFASEKALKIWVWILLKANHRQRYVKLQIGKGESLVSVERGQFLFGRFKAEEELCMDGSTIYRWIKKMEERGMITLEANNHYTVLTVCKYDEYNSTDEDDEQQMNSHCTANEQPLNNTRTTSEQQVNTNKKDKNVKNDKNVVGANQEKLTKEQREQQFIKKIHDSGGKYPKEMLERFTLYWTESNPDCKLMRFEMQKVFDIQKRLATWAGKSYNNVYETKGKSKDDFAKGQSIFDIE